MYSLLVCANIKDISSELLLEKSSSITKILMPSLGCELDTSYRIIPEIKGGWFCISPRKIQKRKLISEFSDRNFSILVYGKLFQYKYNNDAEYIRSIYKDENLNFIRQLEGSFSAIIIDLNRNKIYIVCDVIGQRSLRYHCSRESLFVSSHDIPIVATGFCETNFNLESACSILSFDWSLKGESLLKDVKSIDQNEYIVWDSKCIKSINKPLLDHRERIDSKDIASCNMQIDLMIENILNYTRYICGEESIVEADLTAGIDSRAILGTIMAVINRSQINIYTAGEDNSLDVRIARHIAELYGVKYNNFIHDVPEDEVFLTHSNLLAFFMNGDTNSKRAVAPLPQIDECYPPHFKGLGGEIYRGYYYPSMNSRDLIKLNPNDVIKILQHKFPRMDNLPWASKDLCEKVKENLRRIIYCYYDISQNGSDLIDLFYIYERLGRWGALDLRATWFQNYYSPFSNPALVKLAFKLPPPLGNSYHLHKTIITRFLPEIYYLPINNKEFLPLLGQSSSQRFGKFICNSIDYTYRNFLKNSFYKKKNKSHDRIRSDYFSDNLRNILYEILLEKNSFSIALFGKSNTESLINNHISRKANHLEIIGALITMEQWRNLVYQSYELAKQ